VPVLFYTSTPYRGLDVLLDALPAIRAAVRYAPAVFSGFAASYGTRLEDDPYRALYERCTATDGVDYVGPIAQPDLAREISNAAALAYPSTFAETSCIAVLEAMAAGATIVTTRLGALEETTNGFAKLIDYRRTVRSSRRFCSRGNRDSKRKPPRSCLRARPPRRANRLHQAELHLARRALEWQSWLSEFASA